MPSVDPSYSELTFLLTEDNALELPPPSPLSSTTTTTKETPRHKSLSVSLGAHGAIKLSPRRNGDTHVRIIKHGRKDDLFPADYAVEKHGTVRVQQCRFSNKADMKYDFEVHVDAKWIELLQIMDWSDHSLSGRSSAATLCPGTDLPGKDPLDEVKTGIFIKSENGEVKEYTNDKPQLKILDFDVVDENDDGIFEPGDFIRVEHIKIQNMALVASTAIPLWLVPTRWTQPVDDGLRITDIPANSIITVEGSLRGFIMQDPPRETTDNLCVIDTIGVVARRPDIKMDFNPIMAKKTITIQYPLQLELLNAPTWCPPDSTSQMSWKITNISNKPIARPFATALTIRDSPHLLTFPSSPKSTRSIDNFDSLSPSSSMTIIKPLATRALEGSSTETLRLELFLTEPQTDPIYFSPQPSLFPPLRSLVAHRQSITVSSAFRGSSSSDVLLVTNLETPEPAIQLWKQLFAHMELRYDIFNLGLYHSLYPCGRDVLGMYVGKTVVLLGNEYRTGEVGPSSVVKTIDVGGLCGLISRGTNCLVSGVEIERYEEMKAWMGDVIHGTSGAVKEVLVDVDFIGKGSLEKGVRYAIRTKNNAGEKLSEKLIKTILKHYPTRRFSLTRHPTRIFIHESLDRNVQFVVNFNGSNDTFSRFGLISVLPFLTRLQILWTLFSKESLPPDVTELLTLVITADILSDPDSSTVDAFLTYQQQRRFTPPSIVFVLRILSALSKLRRIARNKDILPKFLRGHYSPDLVPKVTQGLYLLKTPSLHEIRDQIVATCRISRDEFPRRVLDQAAFTSEVREERKRRGRDDAGDHYFETAFKNCLDELLQSIPRPPAVSG